MRSQGGACQLSEFQQFAPAYIRHRPAVHAPFGPVDQVVAALGQEFLPGTHLAGGRPDEEINEMFPPLINQRRHRLLPHKIQTPADQREALSAGSGTGGEKVTFPLNQGLTVCWSVEATSVR